MKNFALFIFFLLVGIFTATGDVQKVVHFSDPFNEFVFCILALSLGVLFLAVSIPDKDGRRILFSKIHRIRAILGDRSEQFEDNPSYRFVIIKKIWRE